MLEVGLKEATARSTLAIVVRPSHMSSIEDQIRQQIGCCWLDGWWCSFNRKCVESL